MVADSVDKNADASSILGKRRKIFQVETVRNDTALDKSAKFEVGLREGDEEPHQKLKAHKTSSDHADDVDENLLQKSANSQADAWDGDEGQSNILTLLKEIKDNQLKFQREQQLLRSLSLFASKQLQKQPRIIQKNQETYNIYGNADGAPIAFKMPTGVTGVSLGGRLQKARAKQAQNQARVLSALELAK